MDRLADVAAIRTDAERLLEKIGKAAPPVAPDDAPPVVDMMPALEAVATAEPAAPAKPKRAKAKAAG